jgi:hypothetical protein
MSGFQFKPFSSTSSTFIPQAQTQTQAQAQAQAQTQTPTYDFNRQTLKPTRMLQPSQTPQPFGQYNPGMFKSPLQPTFSSSSSPTFAPAPVSVSANVNTCPRCNIPVVGKMVISILEHENICPNCCYIVLEDEGQGRKNDLDRELRRCDRKFLKDGNPAMANHCLNLAAKINSIKKEFDYFQHTVGGFSFTSVEKIRPTTSISEKDVANEILTNYSQYPAELVEMARVTLLQTQC